MPLCLMENVSKSYRLATENVKVLKGINLKIETGDFLAVMGVSGSGKTTLMNIIGCLDVPTSGRFVFLNRETSGLTDDELSVIRNKHIGFVFQNFYLLPYATVLENILLPTIYSSENTGKAKEKAIDLLRLVGLESRMNFKPSQLSGGQQQRVAIARALINEPDLILADEPTGQLDSETSKEIISLLSDMHKIGKTVIIVTHDPDIANCTNRLIRINDGIIGN